jgi:hypothetical protein
MSSATNEFLTKRLNVWVNADTAWMDMRAWRGCGDPKLRVEDFAGEECWAALDLATKNDIASKARLFRRELAGDAHYYLFVTNYLNEEAVLVSQNSQYQGWARAGHLTVTPGNVTDFGVIKEELLEDARQFRLVEVPVRSVPGDAARAGDARRRPADGRVAADRAVHERADEGARGAGAAGAPAPQRLSRARVDGLERRVPPRREGQHLPAQGTLREQDRRRRRRDHGARASAADQPTKFAGYEVMAL